jgi:pimeloyl-ACP methyl ester carboxylesterase
MTLTIPGFSYRRIAVTGDVTLNTAVGGSGSPVVLLHGFPQTHLMWRHVAARLAADHTVICPDLRGYGAFGHFLDAWARDPAAIPGDVRAEYPRASREAVPSIVADYRASAGIDIDHDRADRDAGRTLAMPVAVIQQDWGAALGYDAAGRWRAWAPHLVHRTVDVGHFMAEEAPEQITSLLRDLLAR